MSDSPLRCAMRTDCNALVTHLDQSGFVYCTCHGLERCARKPCRKLTPAELRKLAAGTPIARY